MSDIDAEGHKIKNGLPGTNPSDFVVLSQLNTATLSGLTGINIIAGSGLAGGGDLSASRTINIGAADATIVVNPDTIQVGIITTANITNNAVDNTIIRDSVGTSVIGRSANTTGDPADIVAVSSGQFLRRDGSNTLGFGIITTSDLPGSVTSVSGVQIIAGAGLTGGGNLTANRTIDVVAADSTITVNPDSIKVNVITSGNISDNQVNNSILRDSVGNSVIGRTPNTTGDPADIVATASGQFLKRDGNNNVIFGAISLSDLPINIPGGTGVPTSRILIAGAGLTGGGDLSTDRTFDVVAADATITVNADSIQVGAINTANINNNQVDNTKIRDSIATSVIGRSVNSTGDPADIQATASGQFLRRDASSVLGFGAITREDLPGSVTSVSGINIIAGAGLTGGGNLTANRTIDAVAADATITVNPDSIQVGVIQTANIANNAVTFAKMQTLPPQTLLGNDSASTTTPHSIAPVLPLQIIVGDQQLSIQTNGISNTLLRQSVGFSVIGRSASTTGNVADIVAGTGGVALVRNASDTTLNFGKIAFTTIEPILASSLIGNDGGSNEEIIVRSPLQIVGGSGELTVNAPAARTFLGLDVPQTMDLILGFGVLSGDTLLNKIPISESSGHSQAFWLQPTTTFSTIQLDPYSGSVADANLISDRVTEWSVMASFTRCQLSIVVYHYNAQAGGGGSDFTTVKITKNGLRDSFINQFSFNTTGTFVTNIESCSFASGDRVGVIVEPGSAVGGATNADMRITVTARLFK